MEQQWKEYELGELLSYVQPTPYIVESTDYNDKYTTPVLTAGKTFILGYTNERQGIYTALPVIIFDDFTTASRYVNFEFKVKSSAMKILTPNTELVLPKFIYYRMQVIQFDHSTHKRYWIQQYSKIKVAIPPIPVQEQIVSRIEELFSELDNGVKTLQKTKQQLAVYRQAVLKEAFSQISQYVSLGKITDSRLGKMLDKEKNIGIPRKYLRNINVRWFSFDLSDLLEMRIEDTEVDKYSVIKGDLVICEGGEPGRCAVWTAEEPMFYQKALHRVRFTDGSNPMFYMYYLWFASQTGKLNEYFTGMGIKHLTGQSLVKVPVPTVNRINQDKIVLDIESRLSMCDSIEKTVDTALQQAEAMRQSILKQPFEGRL
ncbi:hypothetical protein MM59RIKEN_32320 (plasmid) [Pusillibacter faecalis]|uniref:Type I restriction modification DNA specificity domain-containing protein n=1 Tax=Pusillibacter faecalis TaxID=2714358 RepID=A0A830QS70_9FIRM|nr:restriction endonuclease subunit S [Pusillibacter faecalis]BCK85913.1 hypothetical protein MM59RIKEN_32320 [Pusillibacter faecalis]